MICRLAVTCSLVAACNGTNRDVLTQTDASATVDTPVQNNQPWSVVTSVTTTDLYGVSGASSSNALAVGGTPGNTSGNPGVAVRWDGTNWSVTPNLVNLLSVSGRTAVGEYGGEGSETFWNGASWSSREVLGAGSLRGTWETSPGTYAVGDNGLLEYTSETGIPGGWGLAPSGTTNALHAVWGSSASDVFAVGAGGLILHATNAGPGMTGTWVKTIQGSSTLRGVWGSSANDVYIVGEAPAVILHSTNGGASWTSMAPPTSALGLYAVGGRSASDLYAVGATGGVIFHSSGNDAWTSETVPTTRDLYGVSVATSGEAYAVGRGGTIVHKPAP